MSQMLVLTVRMMQCIAEYSQHFRVVGLIELYFTQFY
jgi:hypothetical protein